MLTQYADIQKPYQFLKDKVVVYQKIAEKQIQEQFDSLIKEKYVGESNNHYTATLKWSAGQLTSNNRRVD